MDDRKDHRTRVLRAGMYQVLWSLLLVYLILLGIALLFGRQVGYEISFSVCLGLAGLVTSAFLSVHVLDRLVAWLMGRPPRSNRSRHPSA